MSQTQDLFDAIVSDLDNDEATRLFVYDDATGKPILPGSHVIGHPTIGTGRALDTNGISAFEARSMLVSDVHKYIGEFARTLPWWIDLDPVRQRVLANMRHQLGLIGLLGFHHMLTAMQAKDWTAAAAAGLASDWHRETPARCERLMAALRTGIMPVLSESVA